MFFVEQHLRGSKFDWEGTNPLYTVVFAAKSASRYLSGICVVMKGVESVALRFSMVAEEGRGSFTLVTSQRWIVAKLRSINGLSAAAVLALRDQSVGCRREYKDVWSEQVVRYRCKHGRDYEALDTVADQL